MRGFDPQLTRYDERGWRATFYTTGMDHSRTSATGTAWERTQWRAMQVAWMHSCTHKEGPFPQRWISCLGSSAGGSPRH
jgi:hypothetical protein